jgi:hypothetical protein
MSRPPDLDPLTEYEQRKATRNALVETALRGDPVALKSVGENTGNPGASRLPK